MKKIVSSLIATLIFSSISLAGIEVKETKKDDSTSFYTDSEADQLTTLYINNLPVGSKLDFTKALSTFIIPRGESCTQAIPGELTSNYCRICNPGYAHAKHSIAFNGIYTVVKFSDKPLLKSRHSQQKYVLDCLSDLSIHQFNKNMRKGNIALKVKKLREASIPADSVPDDGSNVLSKKTKEDLRKPASK